jgi:hypothetical protein
MEDVTPLPGPPKPPSVEGSGWRNQDRAVRPLLVEDGRGELPALRTLKREIVSERRLWRKVIRRLNGQTSAKPRSVLLK